MKTIKTEAEYTLKQMIGAIRKEAAIWRLQLFRLSALGQQNKSGELSKLLIGYIINHVADKEGVIYSCHDGDVIILGRNISKKDFDDIDNTFRTRVLQDIPDQDKTIISFLYDLGVSWNEVNLFCEEKLKAMRSKTAIREQKAQTILPAKAPLLSAMRQQLFRNAIANRRERKNTCVLLVEDDPMSLHLAKKTLEGEFTVLTAATGADAYESYVLNAPDIVFLDIGLPDTNGHQLLGDFNALDNEGYVVMLSGNSFQDEILKAMKKGAKGFIGKPFSRAKLLHYINQSQHAGGQ